MDISFIGALVHENSPHTKQALYLSSALFAIVAVIGVYLRCKKTGSFKYLDRAWVPRVAAWAAPVPVYLLLLVLPFDPDLVHILQSDAIIVALAGLYGMAEALKDVRNTAGLAHDRKLRAPKPRTKKPKGGGGTP